MSWEWQYHWWLHYGKGRHLRIIVVIDQSETVAILPLHIDSVSVFRFWNIRILRLVGTGGDTSPDYLGALLKESHAEELASSVVEHSFAAIPEWDMFEITDLNPESPFHSALKKRCEQEQIVTKTGVSARIAYIRLPDSWETYLRSVSRNRRYTIRSSRKKLERDFNKVRFYVISDPSEVLGALDTLIALHHKRWHAKAISCAFSTPEYVGFHRDAILACAKRGWLQFYCLEVDDQIIAAIYCYHFRNQVFYFQAGFDPEFENYRPGLVLIGYSIEHAIKEGNSVFDFLRGEHEYKNQWADKNQDTVFVLGYKRTPRSLAHAIRYELIPALKRRIKKRFPFLARRSH